MSHQPLHSESNNNKKGFFSGTSLFFFFFWDINRRKRLGYTSNCAVFNLDHGPAILSMPKISLNVLIFLTTSLRDGVARVPLSKLSLIVSYAHYSQGKGWSLFLEVWNTMISLSCLIITQIYTYVIHGHD